MKSIIKITIILSICMSTFKVNAQYSHSGKAAAGSLSSYGSMFLKSTRLMGEYNLQIGGMGAVVFNNKVATGLFGNGQMTPVDFTGNKLTDNNNTMLHLKYGYGGLFVEYFFIRNHQYQVSIPVKMGYGMAGIYDDESDDRLEKSRLLILEPEMNFDFKPGNHVALSAQLGYRFAAVDGLQHISNNQLSGFTVGLGLKFIAR
ncbi:MAG: hypothetical protein R2850_11920 [Bacteroidia bacterium]